ncbi:hypothetical protein K461DRAFT_133821 [Myriangium duriaei CBS 260.36]|uniref:Uncharacterized protein n=1 Tax=Myriangium duriaei CBS 260.36 TaxID=1168546 RepID=A0A9P4J1N0_9PEZI|nr:hypothetical protein K461DRAFT_133821 [Myriangium duriaei CBS 260.36]
MIGGHLSDESFGFPVNDRHWCRSRYTCGTKALPARSALCSELKQTTPLVVLLCCFPSGLPLIHPIVDAWSGMTCSQPIEVVR